MMLAFLLVVLAALFPTAAFAQDVGDQLDQALGRAERALADAFVRSLPLPGASPGVSYSFDPATGTFRRDPATFGQVYLDRAQTLGAGRINFFFAYEYVRLDSIEGHDASNLVDPLPIPLTDLLAAVQIPSLSVRAQLNQFLFAVTYGLGDNADVGLAVPLAYSVMSANAVIGAAAVTEDDELVIFEERVVDEGKPFGVGDILARGKYRFLAFDDFDLAAELLLRFPSGSQSDLQGIGFFEVAPSLLASTRVFEPAPWARLQGHLNATIGFDTADVGASEARWGIGGDWGIDDAVTLSLAFLGRNQFADVAPPSSFLFPRCDTDLITCAVDPSVRNGYAPIFGLTGERPDYYTLSVGGRVALWRETLFGLANVAIPLNDGFVRTYPIPLIGLEGTF